MNLKLKEFKENIIGKKVAVLGVGISNMPLIIYLAKLGVNITAFDKQTAEKLAVSIKKLELYNVKFSLGDDYLTRLKGFDIIFKTPVVRYDIPELIQAKSDGSIITSEMEVFFELCPAKIFGVTGSDGKTTTTTLIYLLLKKEGYNCWLGGNIGMPLLEEIDHITETDMVVVELSSFQLQTMSKSANVSVITNLSPNHMDVHKSYSEYIEAKKNIFKYQNRNDKLILNYDNEETKKLVYEAKGQTEMFSRVSNLEEGFFIENDYIVSKRKGMKTQIIKKDDIQIPGEHNVENFLAAISATSDFVSLKTIKNIAISFNGVEHRNEPVTSIKGINFYNDSIASSPGRTAATLAAYKEKVILIAGGKDKKIPYDKIGKVIYEKVKLLILIGQTSELIESAYKNYIKLHNIHNEITIIHCGSYQDAVEKAYESAIEGDNIILSPASTSFDMFKNFEERGKLFKKIVMELKLNK